MNAEKRQKADISRRDFVRTAAISVGATALTGFGSRELVATQLSAVRKWDYQAEIVILGVGGAGLNGGHNGPRSWRGCAHAGENP
jgi:hypothetical protein